MEIIANEYLLDVLKSASIFSTRSGMRRGTPPKAVMRWKVGDKLEFARTTAIEEFS